MRLRAHHDTGLTEDEAIELANREAHAYRRERRERRAKQQYARPHRVVVDSNALIFARLSPRDSSGRLLAAWLDGRFELVSGLAGRIAPTMSSVTKAQTNGRPGRLSPERLAELTRPAKQETLEEKRAAIKRATEGFRVNVRVTRDMYRPR